MTITSQQCKTAVDVRTFSLGDSIPATTFVANHARAAPRGTPATECGASAAIDGDARTQTPSRARSPGRVAPRSRPLPHPLAPTAEAAHPISRRRRAQATPPRAAPPCRPQRRPPQSPYGRPRWRHRPASPRLGGRRRLGAASPPAPPSRPAKLQLGTCGCIRRECGRVRGRRRRRRALIAGDCCVGVLSVICSKEVDDGRAH